MIRNFTYYTPTKVAFGAGAEAKTGRLVKEQGCRKVLLHYGGGSARRSGLLDRVEQSLAQAGVEYVQLGGFARARTPSAISAIPMASSNQPKPERLLTVPLLLSGSP